MSSSSAAVMSGISFKISAPPRPSSTSSSSTNAAAPPSRPAVARSRSSNLRHSTNGHQNDDDDDSDDDDQLLHGSSKRRRRDKDEELTGFDKGGATKCVLSAVPPSLAACVTADMLVPLTLFKITKRKHKEATAAAPLVIPALPNRDWREAAELARGSKNGGASRQQKKKRKEMYLPDAVGGMRLGPGTANGRGKPVVVVERDVINETAVVGGLAVTERAGLETPAEAEAGLEDEATSATPMPVDAPPPPPPETEEQRALRELLSGQDSGRDTRPQVEIIESAADKRDIDGAQQGDVFKRDVDSRPDEVRPPKLSILTSLTALSFADQHVGEFSLSQASLDDYARVPVGEFGAAMLRGMGWQPGQAATRRAGRKGPTEAFVPTARPAMLGIGAKPMAEVMDGGKGAGGAGGNSSVVKSKSRREEMRFMPLVKREREREGSHSGRSVSVSSVSLQRRLG